MRAAKASYMRQSSEKKILLHMNLQVERLLRVRNAAIYAKSSFVHQLEYVQPIHLYFKNDQSRNLHTPVSSSVVAEATGALDAAMGIEKRMISECRCIPA